MKIDSRNSRDYVYMTLAGLDTEQLDNKAIYGLNEDAMKELCAAVDGNAEDLRLPCLPINLYASYEGWDGMVEFLLEKVEKKEDGYAVTYRYNTVIK